MEQEKEPMGGEITEMDLAQAKSSVARSFAASSTFLLVIFSFLIGFILKSEAVKRITMGFEDYKIEASENRYDLSRIQQAVEAKRQAAEEAVRNAAADGAQNVSGEQAAQPAGDPESGASCTDQADSTCVQ